MPQFIDASAKIHKIRLAKIGPAKKWVLFGSHKHAHRPATASGGGLHKGHVNLVNIRPFLAIKLDAHEVFVEHRAYFLIFKTLPFHHVAPVAGGIADGEKDWLVLLLRLVKGFLTPWKPIHRVVRVLLEVGRFFLGEAVGKFMFLGFHGRLLFFVLGGLVLVATQAQCQDGGRDDWAVSMNGAHQMSMRLTSPSASREP